MLQEVFTEVRFGEPKRKIKYHSGKYVLVHYKVNGIQEFIMNNKSDVNKLIDMLDKGELILNYGMSFVNVNNRKRYPVYTFINNFKKNNLVQV